MEQNSSTSVSDPTRSVPQPMAGVEGEIRQMLEEFADSIRSGKLEDIMSFYDPNLVAFDAAPPLRFTSAVDYRKNWETMFTTAMKFPISYEWSEEHLMASADMGVFNCLVHTAGSFLNPAPGQEAKMDCWGRYTCVLKKNNNRWRIVHEHFSVPVNEEGQGMFNLKPPGQTSH